ncbi:tRNA (adenine(58)-N(1))-methyltransferase catalytic subunit TRMT61A-like [Schistocerca gregaria]|uniref:tRNA (adenine(58)-N(1))-methyltransferase catalytic subunit TRMT61A-like n=1 Tax=Schistocerca gregaria TaxID=7010 RepID=UPI00211E5F1F|nr:tRNA (adenine(58)-N(1))-methyltransferase catalytic subunit TRMT61A-like [Schistocerca gregaria]
MDLQLDQTQPAETPHHAESELIGENSHVILFSTRDNAHSLIVRKGQIFDNKLGHFCHDNMIGLTYGSRLYAKHPSSNWMIVLRPSPELWGLSCTHRTEITYQTDTALILASLNIKPGSIVFETGTGTGCFTFSLVSAIKPNGHVYTFEYHSVRHKEAIVDFERTGISPWVTCIQRDTVETGFPAELDNTADAIFLDLPSPWEVIQYCKKSLKHDGMLASFSPCIEQVQLTTAALANEGFANVETIECLLRTYAVKEILDAPNFYAPPQNAIDHHPAKKTNSTTPTCQDHDPTPNAQRKIPVAKPHKTMKGHTGFLTFARNYKLHSAP